MGSIFVKIHYICEAQANTITRAVSERRIKLGLFEVFVIDPALVVEGLPIFSPVFGHCMQGVNWNFDIGSFANYFISQLDRLSRIFKNIFINKLTCFILTSHFILSVQHRNRSSREIVLLDRNSANLSYYTEVLQDQLRCTLFPQMVVLSNGFSGYIW